MCLRGSNCATSDNEFHVTRDTNVYPLGNRFGSSESHGDPFFRLEAGSLSASTSDSRPRFSPAEGTA